MRRLQVVDPSFLDSHSTLTVILILGTIGVAALVVATLAFRVRSRWLLAATLALGVVQFFGPFGFTSVALLATCTLLPVALWRARRNLRNLRSASTIWTFLLGALALWQIVSVLWSAKLGSAGYGVVISVALLATFLLARDVTLRDARGISVAIAAASPFVIVSALTAVAFRISPELEGAYLLSPVARSFSEPDVARVSATEIGIALDPISTLGIFARVAEPPVTAGGLFERMVETTDPTGFQNVLDPEKSGGVFLNGNTASLFFAIAACAAVWAFLGGRQRALHAVTAAASLAAIVATGSKTALVLLVALPLFALFIAFAVRRPRAGFVAGAGLVVIAAAGVAAAVRLRPGLLDSQTLDDRLTLWRMVAASASDRWFTGFGFGHWREHVVDVWPLYFPDIATQIWPPHNMLLQAWVDAGVVALLLTLALALIPIAGSLRRMGEARHDPLFGHESLRRGVVLIGLLWVFLHGMADTTRFAGDNHTLPFVAVLTALALTRTDRAPVR